MRERGFTIILLLIALVGILALAGGAYYMGMQKGSISRSPTPNGSLYSTQPSIQPTTGEKTGWTIYRNDIGYSIQYPSHLVTQVMAAGSGTKEASQDARSFYIYDPSKPSDPESAIYVTVEKIDAQPTYGPEWIKTPVTAGGKNASKYTYKVGVADSDIYEFALASGGYLEVYVTTNAERTTLANQIFATIAFTK